MHEIVDIPVSDLLLDDENPRLATGAQNQQKAALDLATQQGDALLTLAEHIVKHGLDPTVVPAVVATGDTRKRYKVLEGNRRVLALRALDTPSLIAPALSQSNTRKLRELADRYAQNPVTSIPCALFEREEDALIWIELRHTGQNDGAGLVEWGSEEQDRFHKRHRGVRKPAGQVLEFVEKRGLLSDEARTSNRKVITSIERLLSSPYVRERLGIEVSQGQVVALYPEDQIVRGLSRVVDDLKTGRVAVPDIYVKEDREAYIDTLPRSTRPKKSTRLTEPVVLDDLTSGAAKPRKAAANKPKRPPRPTVRTTVIPKSAALNVGVPRINAIYNELLIMNAEQCPNACSVLLRVFIELSVDHSIDQHQLMPEKQARSTALAKRIKTVVAELEQQGLVSQKLRATIDKVADGQSIVAATVPTFNLYVHNPYVFPRASDLYSTWDEIAPFMAKLWP